MFLRHALWTLHETVGDGVATATVLFESIFRLGLQYLASGGNAMLLRKTFEQGQRAILADLDRMALAIQGKHKLSQFAETLCHDSSLAKLLGEIIDIIGEYGILEVRHAHNRGLEREYVEGMYWNGKVFSRHLLRSAGQRTDLYNPAVLGADLDIKDPIQLGEVLDAVIRSGHKSLLIIARDISEICIGLLVQASKDPEKFQVLAVQAPGPSQARQMAMFQDLSIMTGGHILHQSAGESLKSFRPERLGLARKAWAEKDHFGLVAGRGDPHELRRHLSNLKAALAHAHDKTEQKELQIRIGKILGGSATLWVGGSTEAEIKMRIALAERSARALQGTLKEGVVPGGGVALLACQLEMIQRAREFVHTDERAAYAILSKALASPFGVILENAGLEPGKHRAMLLSNDPAWGIDARNGQVVNLFESGIVDLSRRIKSRGSNCHQQCCTGADYGCVDPSRKT